MAALLRSVAPAAVAALAAKVEAVDNDTLNAAKVIVEDVQRRGVDALLEHARHLGDLKEGEPYYLGPATLREAYDQLTAPEQQLLRRVAGRIDKFARAQRDSVRDVKVEVDGGVAGHQVIPVQRAGCYAPGGRHPLPSSVLMTVCTARAAGVASVIVASPRPTQVTLAAAHVAGADGLLAVGGAQAIAALAYGLPSTGLTPCDVVVGPGSLWVTAAKQLVAGRTGIDMLAGPSECLVLADDTADPTLVAADLIAQAEHDVHARPLLVTTDASLPARVQKELEAHLSSLPTAEVARAAFVANGIAVVCADLDEAVRTADSLAPEHLELHVRDAANVKNKVRHAGALFVGPLSGEVMGDYGAGPNHVLPTGSTARHTGGLSVMHFLRFRSYLQLDSTHTGLASLCSDSAALARLEGLEGHARAADLRSAKLSKLPAPSAGLGTAKDDLVKIGLPKGRMEANVLKLLEDAGVKVVVGPRGYRPTLNIAGFDVKMLKPHNIVEMLHVGSREVGFTGADLVEELSAHTLISLLDTQLDPVRLVAAAPDALLGANKELPRRGLNGRPLVVATEYLHTTERWLKARGIEGKVVHSRGATEGWPPEDADLIVDNCATGSTLKANALTVIEDIATSSTHLYAHPSLMQNPIKKAAVERLVTMLKSVLAARDRMLLEFHVPSERLQEILAFLPAMKQPTIATLHNNAGYALKIAAPRSGLHELFAKLKAYGATDIIATALQHVVP